MKAILAVDEYRDMLSLYKTIFENSPHYKLDTRKPDEAVDLINKKRELRLYSLMIFDLDMPSQVPVEIIKKAYKANPKLKFLIHSGNSEKTKDIASKLKSEGIVAWRLGPFFKAEHLVELVEELIPEF